MQIDQLKTLLAVLEHGSFSRAAQALRVTQSTVSFHVKALEATANAHLLDRRGGKVRPTEAGTILARYAAKILALREEAAQQIGAQERGERGTIRIAASTIPAEYLLPDVLAKFRVRHPGINITVDVSDTRRAAAALLAEECELALLGARIADKRLVLTAFADDEIVLVGAAGGKHAPHGRLSVDELAHVPLVLREEGSGTHEAIARLVASRGASPSIHIGSTEAVKRAVLAGLGLAFLSRHAIADELRAGKLAAIALPGTPVRRKFWAARLRSLAPSPAAKTLLALLSE